jgi:hypothetical protein
MLQLGDMVFTSQADMIRTRSGLMIQEIVDGPEPYAMVALVTRNSDGTIAEAVFSYGQICQRDMEVSDELFILRPNGVNPPYPVFVRN